MVLTLQKSRMKEGTGKKNQRVQRNEKWGEEAPPGRLLGGGDTNSWMVNHHTQSPCPGFRYSVQSSPFLTLHTHPMLPVPLNIWSPFLSLNLCSSHLLCLESCSFRFFTQLDRSQSSALNLNAAHPERLSLSSLLYQSLLSLFLTPRHLPNYWKE